MNAEQVALMTYLGFAALGAVGFGSILYFVGRQHGRAKGTREAIDVIRAARARAKVNK